MALDVIGRRTRAVLNVDKVGWQRRQRTATEQAGELMRRFVQNHVEMTVLNDWIRGENKKPSLPATATKEYLELQEASGSTYAGLVVTAAAQSLYVEGFRPPKTVDQSPLWSRVWQPNGMDARQIAVHRGALGLGQAFVRALPATSRLTGDPTVQLRGVSAIDALGFYREDGDDEYPEYLIHGKLQVNDSGDQEWLFELWEEDGRHFMRADFDGSNVAYIEDRGNPVRGVVPFVRYANMLDLQGYTQGEIEPIIPTLKRLDQDVFDRLVVQRFGSWRVRTIAGMQRPATDEERRAAALALRVEDLLIAENPETKFGTLDATPLDGYIKAHDADLRDLAATSQTPPHHLLGQMANLSAEALAAAEAGLMRKVEERQHSFGESHENVFRLSAHILGQPELARDFDSQVIWRDMESRSLNQMADALVKLATGLKIPVEMLWSKLPWWSDQDTTTAKEIIRKSARSEALMQAFLAGGGEGRTPEAELAGLVNTDVGTGGPTGGGN